MAIDKNNKKHVIDRDGKPHVLYAGLLNEAHLDGLKHTMTTLVQIPNELNGHTAICHALVETSKGTFSGIGDAAPNNVNRMMATAIIRMAETRAKARALRDALNVGELLADDPSTHDDDPPPRAGAQILPRMEPSGPVRRPNGPGVATRGAAPVNQDTRPARSAPGHEPVWPGANGTPDPDGVGFPLDHTGPAPDGVAALRDRFDELRGELREGFNQNVKAAPPEADEDKLLGLIAKATDMLAAEKARFAAELEAAAQPQGAGR